MKTILAFSLVLLTTGLASAQINRGARPAGRPSMPQMQRPSYTPPAGARPSVPMQRPTAPPIQRPSAPSFQRPTTPTPARPTMPTIPNRPTTLPAVKPGMVPRPQPSQPPVNRPNFPSTKPAPLPSNPSTRPNLPGLPENRPTLPNRPEVRPNPLPGKPNRPNIPDRPGTTKPWLPERPGTGGGGVQRPTLPPTWGGNGSGSILHPGVLPTRPNINVNRPSFNQNNFNFNVIAPQIYNPYRPYGNYFRPYSGGVYRPYGYANYGNNYLWGNYYCAHYYHHWHGGYWNGYFPYPIGFVPRPVPCGWFLPPTVNFTYFNPYYVQPATVVQYVNYSQPLPVESLRPDAPPTEAATTAYVQPNAEDTAAKEAATLFDTAREQFGKNDYAAAQATIDKAIAKLPQDPTLHEFRALCFFAQGKYQDAAAAIYAVLAAGPGWNAETLAALYPDEKTFSAQFAALQKFASDNPKAGYAQFLLGYEYLVVGEKESAIAAFQSAAAIDPKDELSANLAKILAEPAP